MEVIAIKPGYYGKLRQPDDKFDVPEGSKATWFVPVKQDVEQKAEGKKQAAAAKPKETSDAKDLV